MLIAVGRGQPCLGRPWHPIGAVVSSGAVKTACSLPSSGDPGRPWPTPGDPGRPWPTLGSHENQTQPRIHIVELPDQHMRMQVANKSKPHRFALPSPPLWVIRGACSLASSCTLMFVEKRTGNFKNRV